MQQFGLDPTHEAFGTRVFCVQIDGHSEFFLKEKLQIHKPRQCGQRIEFDQKVRIIHRGFPPGGGAEKPQANDAHGSQVLFDLMDDSDDGLSWSSCLDRVDLGFR